MKIHNEPKLFIPEDIKGIEDHYKGKYIFESCLRAKDGGWVNQAFAIFYTEKAHPQGSNYFAIGWKSYSDVAGQALIITDGISATEEFSGVLYNDEVFYSRYRHDFRQFPNGLFVDGGRDYTRYGGSFLGDINFVKIKVNKDKLEIVNEEAIPDTVPVDYSNTYISGYLA